MAYPYSCVMALCPDGLNENLQEISKALIQDDELYNPPGDDSYARTAHTHVTALYGIRETECDERVMGVINGLGPLEFTITGFSSFQDPKSPFDVVKLTVESPSMAALHAALKVEFPDNANSFPTYVPHVTLAFVKKGLAPSILERVKNETLSILVQVETIDVSRNDGTHSYYEV